MRELKFKAKIKNGWIYGDFGIKSQATNGYFAQVNYGVESVLSLKDFFCIVENLKLWKTVKRFIGIQDLQNVDAYEGDIIDKKDIGIGEIVYLDKASTDSEYDIIETLPAFLINWHDKSNSCSFLSKENKFKIIGNVIDNPELLKEG